MATLAEKQVELAEWKAALRALRFGQSYSQGDRSLTRASLSEIQGHIARLSREVAELQAASDGATSPLFVTAGWRR